MKKLLFILLAFAPALLFAGELKVSVVDKELEIPLEGVKLSVKANPSASAQTDENGTAVIVIPDNLSSGTVEAALAGYQNASVKFSSASQELQIAMSITDVIEGQALVVNRASPDGAEDRRFDCNVKRANAFHRQHGNHGRLHGFGKNLAGRFVQRRVGN